MTYPQISQDVIANEVKQSRDCFVVLLLAMTFLVLICGLIFLPRIIFASVEVSGELKTDLRINTQKLNEISWNQNLLSLRGKAQPNESLSAVCQLDFRNFGVPNTATEQDLRERIKVQPLEILLKEAYLQLYFNKFDLSVGKQRIVWGTADKLNPTDNLNPFDFTDPVQYGEKLANNAIKVDFYPREFTITGVWLPVFQPAVLSPEDWTPIPELPEGITIRSISTHLPEEKVENSQWAIKIKPPTLFGVDTSVSFLSGWDDLPDQEVIVQDLSGNIDVDLKYYRRRVVGFDFASTLFDLGVWGEGACFIPVEVIGEPYFKCTLGGDYTFKNGIYCNLQYCRGFFDERGERTRYYQWPEGWPNWVINSIIAAYQLEFTLDSTINNYLFLGLEKPIGERYKASLYGGVNIDDSSWVIQPEFQLTPVGATTISLGGYFLQGVEDSKFGQFNQNSFLGLKIIYEF